MSTKTTKAPVDPESKRQVNEQLTTVEEYRQFDAYLRMMREDENRRKKRMAHQLGDVGEEMVTEIETKNKERERERLRMIHFINKSSGDKFLSLKDAYDMPYEDVKPIYERAIEWKKPWWRKLINVFVD